MYVNKGGNCATRHTHACTHTANAQSLRAIHFHVSRNSRRLCFKSSAVLAVHVDAWYPIYFIFFPGCVCVYIRTGLLRVFHFCSTNLYVRKGSLLIAIGVLFIANHLPRPTCVMRILCISNFRSPDLKRPYFTAHADTFLYWTHAIYTYIQELGG